MKLFSHVKNWYIRYERSISSISLVLGFIWNALFLKRVDLFFENFWVVVHLVVIGGCIILINRLEHTRMEAGKTEERSKFHFWLVTILQFTFGGLLSTFLVFYFRSTDLLVTWPFLLILCSAFIANERLKKHYDTLVFQILVFYLALFSFTIFFVPVLVNQIGTGVFLLSGAASLVLIWLFLMVLRKIARIRFNESKGRLVLFLGIMFIGINVLYFSNLIPPIPLSLKDAGVYYSISKNNQGQYVVTGEPKDWRDYFSLAPTISLAGNQPLYVYTAIFSPTDFRVDIIHQWQYYDETARKWVTESTVPLVAIGGRDNGYRTYSLKNTVVPGKWRVNIKTAQGQTLGRLRFNVATIDTPIQMITENKG